MNISRLRLLIGGIVAIIIALLLFLFTRSGGSDSSPPGEEALRGNVPMEELPIGINTTLKSTPVVIAQQMGLFERYGIQARVVTYQSGVEAMSALFSGEVDVATVPEHLAAFNSIERRDFRILAVVNRNQTQELVARRDRGIESPRDLKGRTIGLKKKSSSLYWLYRLLVYNNLSLDDVELIDSEPDDLPTMLSSGTVDAVITWYPHAYNCRDALGDDAYYTAAQLGQDMYWLVVGMEGWLDEHPGIVLRFLQALRESVDYINVHPREAKEIVAEYFNMEQEYVDFEWPLHTFRLELPQSLLLALEQECRWKIKQMEDGTEMPNYLEFIYFDGLASVAPEAVTIVYDRGRQP